MVTALGYGGFLLGPILVGTVAALLGLRLAMGIAVLAGVSIFTLAGSFGARPG